MSEGHRQDLLRPGGLERERMRSQGIKERFLAPYADQNHRVDNLLLKCAIQRDRSMQAIRRAEQLSFLNKDLLGASQQIE